MGVLFWRAAALGLVGDLLMVVAVLPAVRGFLGAGRGRGRRGAGLAGGWRAAMRELRRLGVSSGVVVVSGGGGVCSGPRRGFEGEVEVRPGVGRAMVAVGGGEEDVVGVGEEVVVEEELGGRSGCLAFWALSVDGIIEWSRVRVTESHSPFTIHFVSRLTLTAQRLLTDSSYRGITNHPAIDDSSSGSRLILSCF